LVGAKRSQGINTNPIASNWVYLISMQQRIVRFRIPRLSLSLILGLLLTSEALAQFSPGPLSQAHRELEGSLNCTQCHTVGKKEVKDKCLQCHTPLAQRIERHQGYHGQLEKLNCGRCHREHTGRRVSLIRWKPSRERFKHGETGYELKGKHKTLDCNQCHKPELIKDPTLAVWATEQKAPDHLNRTFLGLDTTCTACHSDVHQGELKGTCTDCHNTSRWQDARQTFDHNQARFALRGAHQKVDCNKCHKDRQPVMGKYQAPVFTGLAFDKCTACHESYHKGQFGSNCLRCHSEQRFKPADTRRINHQRTAFPLKGQHQKVACLKCHLSGPQGKAKLQFQRCRDCHADYHRGAFAYRKPQDDCRYCHDEQGFAPPVFGIKQHEQTAFPLSGAHLAVPCTVCHEKDQRSIFHWNSLDCTTCHTSPHGTQFTDVQTGRSRCRECHSQTAWKNLVFDHQRTRFPLQGKHLEVKCDACHPKNETGVVKYVGRPLECYQCHEDVHAGQFTLLDGLIPCEKCHQPTGWHMQAFEHNRLTDFPLDGRHAQVPCGRCHRLERSLDGKSTFIRFKPIPHSCEDCHGFTGAATGNRRAKP